MSYVEDNLFDGEKVLYKTGLHRIVMLVPVLCGGFFFLLGSASVVVGNEVSIGLFVGGFGALVIALTMAVWKSTEMAVTNKRVIVKSGLLRRRSIDLLLPKVESIIVEQGLFDRMVGYGCVIVKGTGGIAEPFEKVDSPLEFRRQVQQAAAGVA
jgi:uncharacterized membrane protein YdbT with pleckstrin-like domain